ncbi:MAG: DegV family protein [Lachnospiraceae bacterium]|nr:DegV family protein [Lachnospiraceae bacterium]
MAFKIIGDSCCDFTKLQMKKGNITRVPMSIIIGGVEYRDDGLRSQEDWIKLVKDDPGYPKSACPSPDAFFSAYDEKCDNYVVTLSGKLSGVYNSAMVAREMFEEEHEGARIHVFDSKSAAAGQSLLVGRIIELAEAGLPFDEIVKKVEKIRDEMFTIFVLDDLETFKKNGRLKGVKALVATTMNVKPVLIGDDGEIKQIDQAIGMTRAVNRMLYHIEKKDFDRSLQVRITQCDSKELCTKIAKIMTERFGFTDVKIINAGGISTTYENPGGVVMAIG